MLMVVGSTRMQPLWPQSTASIRLYNYRKQDLKINALCCKVHVGTAKLCLTLPTLLQQLPIYGSAAALKSRPFLFLDLRVY